MGPSAWNHGTCGSAEVRFTEPINWRGAIFMPDGSVRIVAVARSAALRSRNAGPGLEKFSKILRRKLRNREAYGKKFDSRLRSFFFRLLADGEAQSARRQAMPARETEAIILKTFPLGEADR